jgi:predicted RNA-binding protein with PUA-like domain
LSLATLRQTPSLASLQVLQKGNRLSITPVSDEHWRTVVQMLDAA